MKDYENWTKEELIKVLEQQQLELSEITTGSTLSQDEIIFNRRLKDLYHNSAAPDSKTINRHVIADILFEISMDGIIKYISPSIEPLYNFKPENFIGKNFFQFVHPDDQPTLFNIFRNDSFDQHQRIEYRFVNEDGTIYWVQVSAKNIYEDGVLTGRTGILRDITESKLHEEKLRKSEGLYRHLVESVSDVIYEVEINGKIRFVSPSVSKVLGYSVEEVIGRNIFEFIHADDVPTITETLKNIPFKDYSFMEYRYYRRDGSIHWVRSSTSALIENDRLIGGIGILTDITDRKLEEQKTENATRLYSVTSHINQAIVHFRDQDELMREICRVAIAYGKFQMAWIGMFDAEHRFVTPVVSEGIEIGYLETIKTRSAEASANITGPMEHLVSGGEFYVCDDIANDPGMFMWREEALKHNYRSSIYLLLKKGGEVFGVFGLYTSMTNYFNPEEIKLLLEIKDDINFALEVIETEKERRQSEFQVLRLSRAVEQSPVSIVITDVEGNIEYANPSARESTGYLMDELVGQNPRVLKSGDTPISAYKELWETIATGNVWKGVFHNKKKNGELYWESTQITPIYDESGRIMNYVAIKEDITERKTIEEALAKSETALNYAQELSGMCSWELNLVTGELFWSNNYYSMMGVPLGSPVTNEYFLSRVFKDDLPLVAEKYALMQETRSPMVYDFRLLMAGDKVKWIRNHIVPVFEGDQMVMIKGVNIDINEQKLAEEKIKHQNERLSAIVKAIPDLLFVVDKEGTYREVYAAEPDNLLVPRESVIGKNIREFFDAEMSSQFVKSIREALEQKEIVVNNYTVNLTEKLNAHFEARYSRIDQDEVLILSRDITAQALKEEEIRDLNATMEERINQRTHELATTNEVLLTEIEERKKAENEITKARNEAESANMAKSEFLSRMSHELRTPMNSILGFAQLLDLGDLSQNQKKGVNHILKSGKHLLGLINEVLDISRIESGKLLLFMEPVQVSSIVEESIDVIRPLAIDKGILMEFLDTHANVLYMKSDRQRLKQVLLNLLNNAIKYNEPGGSVWIEAESHPATEDQPDRLRISITDSGPGISPENLDRLFIPFERIGAEKSSTEGTGLGLAVVKKLLDAMGGEVGVMSKPGTGSTFWIELPDCENLANEGETSNGSVEMAAVQHRKEATILYIEDNQSNIELLEEILKSQRPAIKLITSTKGMDAVNLSIYYKPDLILLDLNLPDIHGSQVLKFIKGEKLIADIPVVVISADAMPNQIEKLSREGASVYLPKPLDVLAFLHVVDDFIPD